MALAPTPPGKNAPVGDPALTAGRSLNDDQHAGSGPALTASGVGVDGAPNLFAPSTDLARGAGTGTSVDIIDDKAVVGATFDKIIKWRLRFEPMYRNFANVRMVDQAAYPGSKVTLFRTGANGLGLAVDPLSEYADPDAVALPGLEDKLDVTVNEYGNSTVVTQRLQRFSWTEINPMQAEYVGRNMRDTVDAIYMNAVYGGGGFLGGGFRQATLTSATGVELTGPGTGALTMADDKMFPAATGHGLISTGKTGGAAAGASTQKLTAAHVRRIVAHFRSLGVRPFADGLYNAFITPEIAIQLREGADLTGWRYPHLDGSANGNIWNGTVGVFEGVRFIEGPQFKGLTKGAKVDKSVNSIINVKPAEAATANILFLGAEGIGDVVVEEPHAVVTPTSDKFGRLAGLGWIGCFGAQVYDNNAGLLVAVNNA